MERTHLSAANKRIKKGEAFASDGIRTEDLLTKRLKGRDQLSY
jgi:hypothetical protein